MIKWRTKIKRECVVNEAKELSTNVTKYLNVKTDEENERKVGNMLKQGCISERRKNKDSKEKGRKSKKGRSYCNNKKF